MSNYREQRGVSFITEPKEPVKKIGDKKVFTTHEQYRIWQDRQQIDEQRLKYLNIR